MLISAKLQWKNRLQKWLYYNKVNKLEIKMQKQKQKQKHQKKVIM